MPSISVVKTYDLVLNPHSAVWDEIFLNIKNYLRISGFMHVMHVLQEQLDELLQNGIQLSC